jgi:hypothetical protein
MHHAPDLFTPASVVWFNAPESLSKNVEPHTRPTSAKGARMSG